MKMDKHYCTDGSVCDCHRPGDFWPAALQIDHCSIDQWLGVKSVVTPLAPTPIGQVRSRDRSVERGAIGPANK